MHTHPLASGTSRGEDQFFDRGNFLPPWRSASILQYCAHRSAQRKKAMGSWGDSRTTQEELQPLKELSGLSAEASSQRSAFEQEHDPLAPAASPEVSRPDAAFAAAPTSEVAARPGVRRALYTSHFLSTWGQRGWEFAIGLIMLGVSGRCTRRRCYHCSAAAATWPLALCWRVPML